MSYVSDWDVGLVGPWILTLLLVLFITLLILGVFGGRPKNFPPGMTILPVVGSLLSMPFGPSVEVIRGMRKKYGDITSFAIFGTRVVVVSGTRLIKEVFALNSTAGRPDLLFTTVRNNMITNGRTSNVGVIGSSGQVWHEQQRFLLRKLNELGFNKSSSESTIVEEIADLMAHLEKDEGRPTQMSLLFHRSILNTMWAIAMGIRYPYGHAKLDKVLKNFFTPGNYNYLSLQYHIPHFYEIMSYLPIPTENCRNIKGMHDFIEDELKEFMANEELRNSHNFAALYLKEIEKKENPNFNMDHYKALINDLLLAATVPTASHLTAIFNLIVKHPLVQRRVQKELDEVVGRDHLPTFSDMERLPYVQATIDEGTRVFSLPTYSLPHMAIEDCKIGGYDIPKGTWLMTNLDNEHKNPENWKNAKVFDPDNFLDDYGNYKRNNSFTPFGVGKRRCTGEQMAKMQVFLFFTHLLHRFTFTLVEEQSPINYTNPSFSVPPIYTVSIKCRPI